MQDIEGFQLIKQGAESKLYKGSYLGKTVIVKERFRKLYRHQDLDSSLTKERTKAEARAIIKCKSCGINTPTLYLVDLTRKSIFMEYFEHGITAKEFIFQANDDFLSKLCNDIGIVLGKMHANNIVHGDLTTSNVLIVNKFERPEFFKNYDDMRVIMIDFGLARTECSAEDKGVDLYVLERALLSTHSIHGALFSNIMKSYQSQYKNGQKEVVAKFEEVRARGRKRTMVG